MTRQRTTRPSPLAPRPSPGFTLVELLVVIGIIGVLLALLFPVIGRVRTSGYEADSRNRIQQLNSAIAKYHSDHNAYPGPLPNSLADGADGFVGIENENQVALNDVNGTAVNPAPQRITMAENLVLGLLGGLAIVDGPPVGRLGEDEIRFDPAAVGKGPIGLNLLRPARHGAYFQSTDRLISAGRFADEAGQGGDTAIPEFVDGFPDNLPVLYLRARKSYSYVTGTPITKTNNPVMTDETVFGVSAYHLNQILPYTNSTIGVGKQGRTTHGLNTVEIAAALPDAYPYLRDPSVGGATPAARMKDSYILISAGRDRVYGTADDLTNFGRVGE